ncbi:unnamed protein product [Bathycoccus prasinos]
MGTLHSHVPHKSPNIESIHFIVIYSSCWNSDETIFWIPTSPVIYNFQSGLTKIMTCFQMSMEKKNLPIR